MYNYDEITVRNLVKLMLGGDISSVELCKYYLKRISKLNPAINGLVQKVEPEQVLNQAMAADKAASLGQSLGRLHGLPITIKDVVKVAGMVSCKGSTAFANKKWDQDATVIQRLRDEGAIILGISNVPEFLLAFETDNLVYGRTNNPWNLNRTSGGSSGGEAALLASGCTALSLGSDACGSIRLPAAWCGVVGLKPTRGRVPTTGTVPVDGSGIFSTISNLGPMGRFVDDVALMYEIISGADGKDPHCSPVLVEDYQNINVNTFNIAWFVEAGDVKADNVVIQKIDEVISLLSKSCDMVQQVKLPGIEDTKKLTFDTILLGGDKGAGWQALLDQLGVKEPSALLQQFISYAEKSEFTLTEFRQRLMKIDQWHFTLLNFMQSIDILICPVSTCSAPGHGKAMAEIDNYIFTMLFNLLGWPAISVPFGLDNNGMPLAVQVVGKPWQENKVLAVAAHIQKNNTSFQLAPITSIADATQEINNHA